MITETLRKKIIALTSESDYEKGRKISKDNIYFVLKRPTRYEGEEFVFRVKSSFRNIYYFVHIHSFEEDIQCNCSCPQFEQTDSCKHVVAVLKHYSENFFYEQTDEEKLSISKKIFQNYLKKEENRQIKEEVFIDYEFQLKDNYWGNGVVLTLKIGTKRMYNLSHKLRAFLEAYTKDEEYKFGKEFTYNPDTHFFSQDTKAVLNFLTNLLYNIRYDGISLDDDDVKFLMPLIKEQNIKVNFSKVMQFIESSPFLINLRKEDNRYYFKIQKNGEFFSLTSDNEYTFFKGVLYHTPKKIRNLISSMKEQKVEELLFNEQDLSVFSKSILPVVKNEIVIDSSIDNLIVGTSPDVQIYFDFKNDCIVAQVKFVYQGEVIDYFDSKNTKVLRDTHFEMEVLEELISYGFSIQKKKIIIDDFDVVGAFLEDGLTELSSRYEVFTSERIKNTSLKKNNHVTTSFSIGQDNIMRFSFELGDINDEEIENILASLKKRKKYYRLKSGDILSLENKELLELEELVDELDMSYEEIQAQGGEIPKYYALYLDSIRKDKYSIIKTNHQFDNFIEEFKKYKNIDLKFSKKERNVLRDYQIEGVKWLYTIYKCGFGGILADEMGLGKSLQTITFFEKVLKEKNDSKFLIVAPTSLLYNWKNEFLKFAPHISVEILSNPKDLRKEKIKDFDKTVYITSYGLVREDISEYEDKSFEVCVIDEAQNIKNPKAGISKAVKSIHANTKLALTGTPIENSVTELWSIFDFIMPGFLSSFTNFQGKYRIHDFDEETNELLKKLKMQIQPFILRRKKLDVAKDLPDKIENTIYIDLSEKEQKIYAAEVKRVKKEMEKMVLETGFSKAKFEILKLITRLRQICITPQILYESFNESSAKIENLMKVLKEVIENGHKVLLFTSFRTALDLVRKELNNNGISSYTIDGSVSSKKRMELVNQFNEDETNVFLIMLKSGGTGLNLTSADVVIHLDLWWNPQVENQATDRTHRIGQTKTVEVIKLIAKGTIEERILELQQKKKILSDKLIESDQVDAAILSKLTEEDIKNLLSYENR